MTAAAEKRSAAGASGGAPDQREVAEPDDTDPDAFEQLAAHLWDIFDQSCQDLDSAGVDLLDQLGISHALIHLPGVGFSPVHPMEGGLFEFAAAGQRFLIVPAFAGRIPCFENADVEHGELVDLIALHPTDPLRWRTYLGRAWALSPRDIALARAWGQPLLLHPHPLSWLRHCCRGTCILKGDVQEALRGISHVEAADINFARQLDRRLRRPRADLPRVVVDA